jgi:hypothetical protein
MDATETTEEAIDAGEEGRPPPSIPSSPSFPPSSTTPAPLPPAANPFHSGVREWRCWRPWWWRWGRIGVVRALVEGEEEGEDVTSRFFYKARFLQRFMPLFGFKLGPSVFSFPFGVEQRGVAQGLRLSVSTIPLFDYW